MLHANSTDIHGAAYVQATDPATTNASAVHAGILWVDTSTAQNILRKRNAANTGWDVVGTSLATATTRGVTVLRDINVKDPTYGALGDGATDDTTAIRAAIAAAGSQGLVFFPAGTYVTQKLTLPTGVILQGAGVEATIIQAKAALNDNLIETTGFLALAGTDNAASPHNVGLWDLTVDGNAASQAPLAGAADGAITSGQTTFTSVLAAFVAGDVGSAIRISGAGPGAIAHISVITAVTDAHTVTIATAAQTTVSGQVYTYGKGHGLALYAYGYTMGRVRVRNCRSWGLWTEWATASPWLAPDGMLSRVSDFQIHDCAEGGLVCRGPHDIQFLQGEIVRGGPGAGWRTPQIEIGVPNKANGAVMDMAHVWGGLTDYGIHISGSGIALGPGMQVEGGRVAQVGYSNGSNYIRGKLFAGGVNASTVKGIVFLANFPGAISGDVTVEDCGGGCVDFTNAGGAHNLTVRGRYASVAAPASPLIGLSRTTPSHSRIDAHIINNDATVVLDTRKDPNVRTLSGEYLMPPTSATTTFLTGTLGLVILAPVDVGPAQQTFSGMVANISVVAAGGTTPLAHLGIYADDGTGRSPVLGANALGEVTFDPTTATGDRFTAFGANLVLEPGRYWLAYMLTSGTALGTNPTLVVCNDLYAPFGRIDAGNTTYKAWTYTASGSAATLPQLGALTRGATLPLIGIKAL